MPEYFSELINLLSMSIRKAKIVSSALSEYRADTPYRKGKALLPFIKKGNQTHTLEMQQAMKCI